MGHTTSEGVYVWQIESYHGAERLVICNIISGLDYEKKSLIPSLYLLISHEHSKEKRKEEQKVVLYLALKYRRREQIIWHNVSPFS